MKWQILIALIIGIGFVSANALQEYYTISDDNFGSVFGTEYRAQTFQVGTNSSQSFYVTDISLKLERLGTVGGVFLNVTGVRNDGTNDPNMSNVITSNTTLPGSQVTTTAGGTWINFTVPSALLTMGKNYSIVLYSNGTDTNNRIKWRLASVKSYPFNVSTSSNNGTNWSTAAGTFMFSTFSTPSAPITDGLCYQETANLSSVTDGNCGLNYTGIYLFANDSFNSPLNTYDGDWNTEAFDSNGDNAEPAVLYVNYTKPINATSSSFIQVCGSASLNCVTNNISIASSCWNYDQNILSFRFDTSSFPSGGAFVTYCSGSSGWINIFNSSSGTRSGHLGEEGMFWNISSGVAGGGNSCTYSGSGNWNVSCTDNCLITTNNDLNYNNFTLSGTGTFFLNANLTRVTKKVISNGCKVVIHNGQKFG